MSKMYTKEDFIGAASITHGKNHMAWEAILMWPMCELAGGNGKNRVQIEVASENDIRIVLCEEIEIPYAEGDGKTLSEALFNAVSDLPARDRT